MSEIDPSLTPFLSPRGVVLVGASTDPTKLGYGIARNLIQSRYSGAIHFINPKGGTLFGRAIFTRIADLPDPVDLAVLLIPAPMAPQSLLECGERGIKAVVISSGGFSETGHDGALLEKRCIEIARRFDMRIIGPNCVGILNTHLPLDATFLPPPTPAPGEIAFISHSGAICAIMIDWARGQGFGYSQLYSLGNQADVCETDLLAPIAADPETQALTLYLEGIRNGRRFVTEARRTVLQKPVLALKVGRFSSGQRAVASHTGALAGQENAYDAAFKKSGVMRANTTEEMFDWARALAWCPLPRGRNVAVLTNAGGPGVTAADALEANGLHLVDLQPATTDALRAFLPAAAGLHNPVDMLASAPPEHYARALRMLLEDPGVDSVMVIVPPPPMFSAGAVAKEMIPVIQTHEKPVVVALMGEKLVQEAVEHFRAVRIPDYRFPERAAGALAALARRAEFLANAACQEPAQISGIDTEKVRLMLENSPAGAVIPQEEASRIMDAYGIRIPPARLATSPEEVVAFAEEMGLGKKDAAFVLKIASPDILHKSDAGGVLVNLKDAASLHQGAVQILKNARAAFPQAQVQGIYVQLMIPTGQDVIIGAVADPQFGPMMMFGSGGVEVEGLKDVSFALTPLTCSEAEEMLSSTWAGRKLKGFRNLPAADRPAVVDALLRLAKLADDFPQIAEIEINPLRVLAEGEGVYALDVRARLKT